MPRRYIPATRPPLSPQMKKWLGQGERHGKRINLDFGVGGAKKHAPPPPVPPIILKVQLGYGVNPLTTIFSNFNL